MFVSSNILINTRNQETPIYLWCISMYSNSSTYLHGGNSTRPGPSQYGQPSFPQAGPGLQQSNGLGPQTTGFQGAPLQQQYTGFPGQGQQQNFQALQQPQQQQQQPQYTGYPPQNQQPSQQQQFQTAQTPQQQVIPQKTGQTSSQIAASFSSADTPPVPVQQLSASGAKIPKIRLSFLTATDQAKFEQLFKSAVGEGQALDGRILSRLY